MKYDARLILKKNAQPPVQRALWGSVTAMFWLLYLYLWLPLITLAMWLLGINNAFVQLFLRRGNIDPYILYGLPSIALVCTAVLILWSGYNRLRFGGLDRRATPTPVTLEATMQALGADAETTARLRAGKWVTLVMNDQAQPVAVRDHSENSAAPTPDIASDATDAQTITTATGDGTTTASAAAASTASRAETLA